MSSEPKTVRLTDEASRRFADARRIRKWSYTVIATEAINALFKSDPELAGASTGDARRRRPARV